MDISIPGPSKSPSCSSQTVAKRPSTHTPRKSNAKAPKRRKQITDRSVSEITVDNDDIFNSRLSAKTKETVFKLKKLSDPFDHEIQYVVDGVFDHFAQNAGDEDVDLAESALLLSSVTHVYTSQVKSLHEEVLAIANRLSGKENPPKRGRKKNDTTENTDANPTDAEKEKEKESSTEEVSKDGVVTVPDGESTDSNKVVEGTSESKEEGVVSESTNPDGSSTSGAEEGLTPSADPEHLNTDAPVEEGNEGAPAAPENEAPPGEELPGTAPVEGKKLESEILSEIPGRCTRRQSERLKNILNIEKEGKERDYTLKKRKYDGDPPDLISCFDEWNEIQASIKLNGDVDVDEILPPVLEIMVGRKRKKVTINNNELTDDGGGCEACHTDNGEPPERNSGADQLQAALQLAMSAGLNSHQYETLDHLSNDVQERFHALIQEMHKLPFDYGLMQQDMFKAYQQKFLQAVSLLSQNSVLVKRSETGEPVENEPIAPVLELNDSQMSETDQTISSITELLNQVRTQAAEEYHKGTQSKTDAEVPISQMIATLKRIICSRYKKYHVRTDNDKAVFQRIKEFEDKVKSVLIKEAEQGLFDVKKYEMEVMDVTIKETQDTDADDLFCPLSPIMPMEGAESPRPEERNWGALATSSRRSSIAGSIDGSSSWIRLYDIFSHMKKIDNSETCRHFYAVLALLSHKNLNVNYDTLFSKESAKLITKLLRKTSSRNDNINDKYPVGAKIMTSRCPDVDRDEVFLTPVINPEAIHQVLEQDGYLSSSGYQSDGQGSSSTSGNGMSISYSQAKTIQDAISEFVVDPGEPFTDHLFSSKRRRKN